MKDDPMGRGSITPNHLARVVDDVHSLCSTKIRAACYIASILGSFFHRQECEHSKLQAIATCKEILQV